MESTQQRKGNGAEEFVPMPPTGGESKENAEPNQFLERAKSTASETYDKVSERTLSSIEHTKAGLTDGIKSVADSIRLAGDELSKTAEDTAIASYSSRYAVTAAEKLEGIADYFGERDLRAISVDLQNYARRNPAVFLGAAFGLGLLAVRFLKSSSISEPKRSTEAGKKTTKARAKSGRSAGNTAL